MKTNSEKETKNPPDCGWSVSIFFGLYSMDLLPIRLPNIPVRKDFQGRNLLSAILFGLAVGGLSTVFNSCCNPLFPLLIGFYLLLTI
jgi:hypothetical protein